MEALNGATEAQPEPVEAHRGAEEAHNGTLEGLWQVLVVSDSSHFDQQPNLDPASK